MPETLHKYIQMLLKFAINILILALGLKYSSALFSFSTKLERDRKSRTDFPAKSGKEKSEKVFYL